jgi:hypothetical protein
MMATVPVTYTIDKSLDLVVITATGVITADDLRELQARGRADPEFDPHRPILIDLTGAELQGWTGVETRRIAGGGVNTRRALLVASDLAYGIGRMLQAETQLLGQDNVQVFRDRAAALAWVTGKPATSA